MAFCIVKAHELRACVCPQPSRLTAPKFSKSWVGGQRYQRKTYVEVVCYYSRRFLPADELRIPKNAGTG